MEQDPDTEASVKVVPYLQFGTGGAIDRYGRTVPMVTLPDLSFYRGDPPSGGSAEPSTPVEVGEADESPATEG